MKVSNCIYLGGSVCPSRPYVWETLQSFYKLYIAQWSVPRWTLQNLTNSISLRLHDYHSLVLFHRLQWLWLPLLKLVCWHSSDI